MDFDLINEVNEKYTALEAEVDSQLNAIKREEERLEKLNKEYADNNFKAKSKKILSYEESMQRNAERLKSIDMAKARLRSRSTFSPVEKILKTAIEKYKKDLECSMQRRQSVDATADRRKTTWEENENIYEILENE